MFEVLDLYERRPEIVPAAERHWTNQLALALCVAGDGLPVAPLPVAANLSTTVPVNPMFAHEVTPPFVLHYHNEMTTDGFVLRSRHRAAQPPHRRLQPARGRSSSTCATTAFRRPPSPGARCGGSRAAAGTRTGRSPGVRRHRLLAPVRRQAKRLAAGYRQGGDSAEPPPFPFIVGCGRSGTTLLRAMLDAHPDLAIPDEVGFVVRYARPHYALRYGWPRRFDAGRCAELFSPTVVPAVGAADPDVLASRSDRLRQRVVRRRWSAGCTAVAAEHRGKPRFGDKTPMHVLHLPRLARMFPEARFVHIIRDGRDVALSYLSVAWGPDDRSRRRPSVAAQRGHGRRAGARLGPGRYHEVRYEELVADPEPVAAPAVPVPRPAVGRALLRHDEQAEAVIAATRFPAAHQQLRCPPRRVCATGGRRCGRPSVGRFEAIAGPLLDQLGYGR